MNDRFGPASAALLPDGDRRRPLAEQAAATPLPSIETEEWRYSPIGDLPLGELSPVTEPPAASGVPDPIAPLAGAAPAATITLLDGWVVGIELAAGWAEKGLSVTAEPGREPVLDGAGELTAFDRLHRAFSPATAVVRAAKGLSVREPIVVVNHQTSAGTATFPHLVVEADEAADVLVVEHQTSGDGPGLSVPIVELRAGPSARLRYQVLQDLGRRHWQLGRQLSQVAGQATLGSGIAAFGGHYARLRADSRLTGRGASAELVAAYYGDGDQIHDFRIFQHHDAPDTRSDLLFKGAQDDASGSVYTGLIHIHPDGAGTNAFQTNRNVKLSPDAWAWSVPNLEIENNDVHCSHASTVSPVDEEQRFYLGSRGVPPVVADRLIVAGFFDEVIGRLPAAQLRDEVRRHVSTKLDRRDAR